MTTSKRQAVGTVAKRITVGLSASDLDNFKAIQQIIDKDKVVPDSRIFSVALKLLRARLELGGEDADVPLWLFRL